MPGAAEIDPGELQAQKQHCANIRNRIAAMCQCTEGEAEAHSAENESTSRKMEAPTASLKKKKQRRQMGGLRPIVSCDGRFWSEVHLYSAQPRSQRPCFA